MNIFKKDGPLLLVMISLGFLLFSCTKGSVNITEPGNNSIVNKARFSVKWKKVAAAGEYRVQVSAYPDFDGVEREWETQEDHLDMGVKTLDTILVSGLYYFRVRPVFLGFISGPWSEPVSIRYFGSRLPDVELNVSGEIFNYEEDLTVEVSWTQKRDIRGSGVIQVSEDSDFSRIVKEINLEKAQSGHLTGLLPGVYHIRAQFTYDNSDEVLLSDTIPLWVHSPLFWWKGIFSINEDRSIEAIDLISRKTLFSLDGDSGVIFRDAVALNSGYTAVLGHNEAYPMAESRWVVCLYNQKGILLKMINIPEADEWERLTLTLIGSDLYIIGGTDRYDSYTKDVFPVILSINTEISGSYDFIDIGKFGRERIFAPPSKSMPADSEFPFSREWVRDMVKYGDKYYILSEGDLERQDSEWTQDVILTVCDSDFNILMKETWIMEDSYLVPQNILDVNEDRVLFYFVQAPSPPEAIPHIVSFNTHNRTSTDTALVVSSKNYYFTHGRCSYYDGTILLGWNNALFYYESNESGISPEPVSSLYPQISSPSFFNDWELDPGSFMVQDLQIVSQDSFMISGTFSTKKQQPLLNTIFLINRKGDILWQKQELYGDWQDSFSFTPESLNSLLDVLEFIFSDKSYLPEDFYGGDGWV